MPSLTTHPRKTKPLVSIHHLAAAHEGWLPPRIDTARDPLPDAVLTRDEVSGPLDCAVRLLELRSGDHARAFAMHVNGAPSRVIARQIGATGPAARTLIREARQFLAHQLGTGT